MMTDQDHKCKWYAAKCWVHYTIRFVDSSPRTGWYLALFLILNYVLDFLRLFH